VAYSYILILPANGIMNDITYRYVSVIQCSIFVHIAGNRYISIC